MSEIRLFDIEGRRLYLTAEERTAFLDAARQARPVLRTLCETLAFTGCRISEALELTPARFELDSHRVVIRSLKKRKDAQGKPRIVHRAVPVPPDYVDTLQAVHALRQAQKRPQAAKAVLWSWSRQHAWQLVREVMLAADIPHGPHRTAKGLRHGYGVHAISAGVPLNMLQKWMGHADISTTAIYADARGPEEASIAERMWLTQ